MSTHVWFNLFDISYMFRDILSKLFDESYMFCHILSKLFDGSCMIAIPIIYEHENYMYMINHICLSGIIIYRTVYEDLRRYMILNTVRI